MDRKTLYGLAAILLGSCSAQRENPLQESGATRHSYQQPGHKCVNPSPSLEGVYGGMPYTVEIGDGESTIVKIRGKDDSYLEAYVHRDKRMDRLVKSEGGMPYDSEPIRKIAIWSGLEETK